MMFFLFNLVSGEKVKVIAFSVEQAMKEAGIAIDAIAKWDSCKTSLTKVGVVCDN